MPTTPGLAPAPGVPNPAPLVGIPDPSDPIVPPTPVDDVEAPEPDVVPDMPMVFSEQDVLSMSHNLSQAAVDRQEADKAKLRAIKRRDAKDEVRAVRSTNDAAYRSLLGD